MATPPRPAVPPDPGFRVRAEPLAADAHLVEVEGDLDFTVHALERTLDGLMEAGGRRLVVDLSELALLDTTTLDVLVAARERLAQDGGRLELVVERPDIRSYFALTGLELVFSVHDRRERALAALGLSPPG